MNLIPEWRRCWRMFSTQAMAAAVVVQSAWVAIPADMLATIPSSWVRVITIVLLIAGIIGRLVDQPSVSGDKK